MNANDRLYTLDAMRGVAALLVVIYHVSDITGYAWLVRGGYLAVDFFFALSGLVIARAYDSRLLAGLRPERFILNRFIRFYPMFAIGLAFALVNELVNHFIGGPDALTLTQIGIILATEAFMFPSLTTEQLFPLNSPAWSLFLELVINLAYACLLIRFPTPALVGLAVAAAIGMIAASMLYGHLDVGWYWTNLWGGFARVTYAFTAGVLIHRLGLIDAPRISRLMFLPMAALIFFIIAPVSGEFKAVFDLSVAIFGAPVLVVLGGRWQPPPHWRGFYEVLGDLSYPVYAVHAPLVVAAMVAARTLGVPPLFWAPPLVLGLAVFAYGLGRWVDPILRNRLDRLLKTRLARPMTQS